MLSPDQISARLRHIAAKLDNSKRPDRGLVAAELGEVLADIEGNTVAPPEGEPSAEPTNPTV